MASIREIKFDVDKGYAYRALQDARAYNTDVDRSGAKAEAIYKRLARADRTLRPWSTDGTEAQSKKAIEYLREIKSILSHKIGPASRREFVEQGGTRHLSKKRGKRTHHAAKKKDGLTVEQRVAAEVTLVPYGGRLTDDGHIARGDKVTGVRLDTKKGRLRMISDGNDAVLATYPSSRVEDSVSDFVEKFWFWKKAG